MRWHFPCHWGLSSFSKVKAFCWAFIKNRTEETLISLCWDIRSHITQLCNKIVNFSKHKKISLFFKVLDHPFLPENLFFQKINFVDWSLINIRSTVRASLQWNVYLNITNKTPENMMPLPDTRPLQLGAWRSLSSEPTVEAQHINLRFRMFILHYDSLSSRFYTEQTDHYLPGLCGSSLVLSFSHQLIFGECCLLLCLGLHKKYSLRNLG